MTPIIIYDIILNQAKGKFAKILITVDGSEQSMKAADYAIAMAKKEDNDNKIQMIALHVLFSQTGYAYSTNMFGLVTPSSINEILEDAKLEAQQWFDKIKEKISEDDIQLKTEVVVSPTSVVGAIVDYAEHENVDLIVIGSRGRSGFKKLLLGSTASGVITYATCPVLVVK
jgi:nucleotide-binding universal stress UspA family protein